MIKSKRIESGAWRTVESFWNAKGTAFFRMPAGASIKVRYGAGFVGFDSQKQSLDGANFKKLTVGIASLGYARIQMRVTTTQEVTYDIYGGGIAVKSPEIAF